jgi:hypothetical protein
MAINMGIGRLGGSRLIFKRKFRWTFEVRRICNGVDKSVPAHFVKIASRPNLTIEEQEINFLNQKTWIPGKASWETITVTYYDVATRDAKPLYDWLASVYDFSRPVQLNQATMRQDYSGAGVLFLYDGCGNSLERWVLNDMWPTAVNFGELDFSSSEEVTIELTLRYSDVQYQSLCPNFRPENCCNPCTGDVGGSFNFQTGANQTIGGVGFA